MPSDAENLWLPPSAAQADVDFLAKLVADVIGGTVALDAAKEMAREGARRGAVTVDSVKSVLFLGPNETSLPESYRQSGWFGLRASRELAYEAARAMHEFEVVRRIGHSDTPFAQLWLLTGHLLLQALSSAVGDGADLRLLLRAEEVAEDTLNASEVLPYPESRGLLLLEYGRFHLLAHTTNRTPGGPTDAINVWFNKPLQEGDLDLMEIVHKDTQDGTERQEWPGFTEAFSLAERCLREALPLVPAQFRLLALLALVSTLEWRWRLEHAVDRNELRDLAQKALDEVDPKDLGQRLQLVATLSNQGVEPDFGLITSLEEDWKSYVVEAGEYAAWSAVHQAAYLLSQHDPSRALRLLGLRQTLSSPWEEEGMVSLHLSFELQLFAQAYGPYGPAKAGAEFERAAGGALLLANAGTTPFGARAAAAALAGVMIASLALDRPSVGLKLSDALKRLDLSLWGQHKSAIDYLLAKLRRREAALRTDEPVLGAAVQHYCDAALGFGLLKMRTEANECLDTLSNLLDLNKELTSSIQLAAWLERHSLWFEVLSPSSAPDSIQRLAIRLLARFIEQDAPADPAQSLIGVIKGRRYEAMRAQSPRKFEPSSEFDDLLRSEDSAALSPPIDAPLSSEQFARSEVDDYVLAAWVNDYERDTADSPAARLAGVQRSIERAFWATMGPQPTGDVLTLANLLGGLDDQTALLQLVEGVTRDGHVALHRVLINQGSIVVSPIPGPEPRSRRVSDAHGRRIIHSPLALPIVAFRRNVQEDPGPLDLIPEGKKSLAPLASVWLGQAFTERERLQRNGVKNLIIVPHGPSHYLPFHLLGDDDGPIAEHFVVSQLLHVSQILPSASKPSRKKDIGVFGLSYVDQSGFAVLDDSYEECAAIAEICQTNPCMDRVATPTAFKGALESCRYVHLRAHGRVNVDAPSLHTVFLHPGAGKDGRVRAYEISALDLSGLELITLGACETGLGRLDQFDNPRGFPAMLMLAGAKAVIGTLWPTMAAASRFFFSRLYEELMAPSGGALRSCFQSARLATRELYPQYRDWGAFYLIGGAAGSDSD